MSASTDPTTTHVPIPDREPAGFARRVLRKPSAYISIAFLIVVVLAAALAPLVAPYSPIEGDLLLRYALPSPEHWLGCDSLGRDIVSRLIWGGQESLSGVAIALFVLLLLSIPLGLIAGYFRGWTDRIISNILEVVLSVPIIIIMLAVLAIFSRDMVAAMIAWGVLSSASLARIVRGATIAVRQELYVDAARVSGVGELRILFRHILPRITAPIIVQLSLFATYALLMQTGLSFLGLGAPPPSPAWGNMVSEAASAVFTAPWLILPAGLAIALVIVAFGLIGDAARDATQEGRTRTAPTVKPRKSAIRASSGETAAPTQDMLLSVKGLTVDFFTDQGPRRVVDGASFDLAQNETLGLVGESGSGKTVMALSLLNLLPSAGRISAGHAYLEGWDLVGRSLREMDRIYGKRIAMVSQEPMASLDPNYTVGNQLDELAKRHHGLRGASARSHTVELLRTVQLPSPEAVAKRYPFELSGGMAQRVVIAMALMGEPDVLIADEPTTALDVTVQAEILDLLRQLQAERGMAVILVTHDLGVAADFCSRVVVMQHGQIIERATIDELFANPQNDYTRRLINATPSLIPLPPVAGIHPKKGTSA